MFFKSLISVLLLSAPLFANAAVIANIGEKALSDDQLRSEYESISGEQRKVINEDLSTRRNLIENAINAELLVQASKKAGLDKDEDYRKALDRFQRQYLATKFLQKAVDSKITNSEVKKYFESNKTFFDSTQACASHIVMQNEKEAQEVFEQAKKKGVKFEELAKKHSLDPSVQENKGNLGCFTRERMVPEFTATVFNMKKGEIKGPIRTMYGFHVIRLNDTKPGKIPGFAEIEDRVKETYRVKVMSETLQDLRTKSNVKVNEEEAKKFKL